MGRGMGGNEIKESAMDAGQIECFKLFCDLVYGKHHIVGKIRECGNGLLWNSQCLPLASFDFDHLTRLVLMAHERCIRVEICPSGPGMIGITAHKRESREGEMWARHPTIEQSIEKFAARNLPAVTPHK